MAPLILTLRKCEWAQVRVVATAQHRRLLDEVLEFFGITPDIDLDIMRAQQPLADLTARLLSALDCTLEELQADIVIAQGDTTTVLAAAMAAFYRGIHFCHVEAGLRTGDVQNPFPEEMNRVLVGRLTSLHFAPTESARAALLQEGVPSEQVFVTGNTVIDALLMAASMRTPHGLDLPRQKKLILLTAHRRENFGAPLAEIFSAVLKLARRHPMLHFVYPVHPNPNVKNLAEKMLAGEKAITLCQPLGYGELVTMMQQSWLILTDSGGIQEEAPALGKPVLILRNNTERQEAVQCGAAQLVGHDPERIITAIETLLDQPEHYRSMAQSASPFGDGHAAERITQTIQATFCRI